MTKRVKNVFSGKAVEGDHGQYFEEVPENESGFKPLLDADGEPVYVYSGGEKCLWVYSEDESKHLMSESLRKDLSGK